MLDIDKSTVDFLVTENMVQEVEKSCLRMSHVFMPLWAKWFVAILIAFTLWPAARR